MRIEIDDKSGFCFGVVRAITEAEKALAEGGTVYSLGDIGHNRIEGQRLEREGVPRCEALEAAAGKYCCSYEKARNAFYTYYKHKS